MNFSNLNLKNLLIKGLKVSSCAKQKHKDSNNPCHQLRYSPETRRFNWDNTSGTKRSGKFGWHENKFNLQILRVPEATYLFHISISIATRVFMQSAFHKVRGYYNKNPKAARHPSRWKYFPNVLRGDVINNFDVRKRLPNSKLGVKIASKLSMKRKI